MSNEWKEVFDVIESVTARPIGNGTKEIIRKTWNFPERKKEDIFKALKEEEDVKGR